MRKKKQVVAICYDFDGTLIRGNMQESSFIPDIGQTPEEFWKDVKKQAKDNDMDEVLAYMQVMLKKAEQVPLTLRKANLKGHGENLSFFNGVEKWFDLINKYVKNNKNIKVQHFVISSGIDEVIKGSKIHKKFEHIFASGFSYNANDVPDFAARSINYTTKVQYLFRINKGVLNNWDNEEINKVTPLEKRPIPFPRMIYIGDGDTDVPTMKMVNSQGGYSIAVYPYKKGKRKTKEEMDKMKQVNDLARNDRAHFAVEADYSKDKGLYKVVTKLIDRISNEIETKMNLNASGWRITNPYNH